MALSAQISDDDLADHGREDDIHITVKYGLTQKVSFDDVKNAAAGSGPIDAVLDDVSLFTHEDFDVVKIGIKDCPKLHALNKAISKLPNEDKFPVYKPHCTIAYVKAGSGKKYVQSLNSLSGTKLTFSSLTFSHYDDSTRKSVSL